MRSIGVAVEYIKKPLDLLIHYRGQTALMEVKMEEGRFTKDQVEFMARWPGPIHVVRSVEEAIRAVVGDEAMR